MEGKYEKLYIKNFVSDVSAQVPHNSLMKKIILRKIRGWGVENWGSKKLFFGDFGCLSLQIETTFFLKMSGIKMQNFFS